MAYRGVAARRDAGSRWGALGPSTRNVSSPSWAPLAGVVAQSFFDGSFACVFAGYSYRSH